MILESPPFHEDIVVAKDQRQQSKVPALVLNFEWQKWFGSLVGGFVKTPTKEAKVNLTGQAASIGATALPLGSIPAGIYRVSYYVRVTTPDSTSLSLTMTFAFTDRAVSQSQSAAAMTGNTITTLQFGTLIVRVDRNTPVTYAVTYTAGTGDGRFALDVAIEQLALD